MVQRYPRLGELVIRLTGSLAVVKSWDKKYTMDYVGQQTGYDSNTVYRWQQGRLCPPAKSIEILAKIGKEEANLDRSWGESLLRAALHPDTVSIVNKLWGPKELRAIPCNLPAPEHTTLIGRQKEIEDLFELLSPHYAAHLISVDGIGGVGKTALIIEAAYRCLRASTGETPNSQMPTFDAIIFVSAKQQYLTASGILSSSEAQRTLRDMFREIAQTLNRFEITQVPPADQPSKVRDALSRQRTLLIVDNLETMTEKQEIVSFLYRLPPQVKVVMTTRERALFSPIRLEELVEEEALNLIKKEVHEKGAALSTEQAFTLYRRIGGVPAALVYSIGQIASGHSIKTVLDRVLKANGDVAHFCFEGSIRPLRGSSTHKLLMAMAMFPKHPLREAIAHTAGLIAEPNEVEDGLAQLQQLSLVTQQEGRYKMLPLTREYALAELTAYPEFEREARKRWVEWYIHFIEEHGGVDWAEWHIHFDQVEEEWENILAVCDWNATYDGYDTIHTLWQHRGIREIAHIYGYWDDRLTWLNWLTRAGERRGDWATVVEAMGDVGFTLSLIGDLEKASIFFQSAWNLREHASAEAQINLAIDTAFLHICQQQYIEALFWLRQSKNLLDTLSVAEPLFTRLQINFQYYQGVTYYEMQDYDQAEAFFREALQQAQGIGWQRAVIHAQNHLADISIIQGRLEEAEKLLQTGLLTCERNKDKRRVANYRCSFAYLRQKQGNLEEARNLTQMALDGFERLGMQIEVKEMSNLLKELQI